MKGYTPRYERVQKYEILNGREHTTQEEKPKNTHTTTQEASVFYNFLYNFEHLAHPGEDLGAKGIQSESQRLLFVDCWWNLVPIWHHFGTIVRK